MSSCGYVEYCFAVPPAGVLGAVDARVGPGEGPKEPRVNPVRAESEMDASWIPIG